MHNLHFFVVKAETGEEAMDITETEIEDWGSEDNWRTICGAVSEKDEVVIANDGRYPPSAETNTIEKINNVVRNWMGKSDFGDGGRKILKKVALGKRKLERIKTQGWWEIKEYAEYMRQRKCSVPIKKFNVLKNEFYPYEYDQMGVTHSILENDGILWVVFIDMHS